MHQRPFRFGVNLVSPGSRAEWVSLARRAEDLGFDVVCVPDHLGRAAPVATLMLVAEATERARIGTSVLNTAFYAPALLLREIATVDRLSGGRVEVGLGAGYIRSEFDAAGLAWPGPADRVAHLERTVELFRDPTDEPGSRFFRPGGPPILVAGRGDRVLRLAAERADIVAFTGTTRVRDGEVLRVSGADELAGRVAYVRGLLDDRDGEVELNLTIQRVLPHGTAGAVDAWGHDMDIGADELAEIPTFLVGPPAECADRLRDLRDRLGLTYFTVTDKDMEAFAPIVEHLR